MLHIFAGPLGSWVIGKSSLFDMPRALNYLFCISLNKILILNSWWLCTLPSLLFACKSLAFSPSSLPYNTNLLVVTTCIIYAWVCQFTFSSCCSWIWICMPKPSLAQPFRLINSFTVSMRKSDDKLCVLLKNDNKEKLEHMNTWNNFDVKRQYVDLCRQYSDLPV